MTPEELNQYIDAVRLKYALPFFMERFFRTNEEWERVAASDFRHISWSSRTEASLDQVISRPAAIILGEPGAGKSTLVKAVVQRTVDLHMVPLVAQLRSYAGDLAGLLAQEAPADLLRDTAIAGTLVRRILILDGLDEMPQDRIEQFVTEFDAAVSADAYTYVVLTSRQAFYATHRRCFTNPPEAFYILGLSERDVRSFIHHHAGDLDVFSHVIERFGLWSEITNPFSLEVLYQMFSDTGSLGTLHCEAIHHVIESLIARRPGVVADRQRRALRMLAVAMETASRNELLMNEAVQLLQAAMPLPAQEADDLLNELTLSILIRTPDGIAFQMRSYGEYLAAVELSGMSLDKMYRLINYEHTEIPNESWRNCVSYLVELHPGVRRSFAMRHPDWVIAASPNAFIEEERDYRGTVIAQLLDKLEGRQQYITRHPFLDPRAVARFVTPDIEHRLAADLTAANPVRAGNAMLLLGACKVESVIDVALATATDRDRPRLLRQSAIGAVASAGDASLIPTLTQTLNSDDPLHLSLIDCIGALTDEATIPTVLPLLLDTDAMVSSAFHRFRELRSREAVESFLNWLAIDPAIVDSMRFGSYGDPMWETMADLWDPNWADTVADLLIAWAEAHITERRVNEAIAAIERLPDGGEAVGRAVLEKVLATGADLPYLPETIFRCVSPAVAGWLSEQPNGRRLMERIARRGGPEVRDLFAPYLGGLVEQEDQAVAAVRQAHEAEGDREKTRTEAQQDEVRANDSCGAVLRALSRLDSHNWPQLDAARMAWLAQGCEDQLQQIDPGSSVHWHSENELTCNRALHWLVQAIDHYRLRVTNDVLLIQSMLATESGPIAAYQRRHGLSEAAVTTFERILSDPNTPSGAVYHFLDFLGETDVSTPTLGIALVALADDSQRPHHIRSWAIRLAGSKGVPDAELAELAEKLPGPLKNELDRELIDRQHRPTIERRSAALLADDAAMRAGEVAFPHDSSLGWIGHITSDVFWPRLVALRIKALSLELPGLTGVITDAMANIDGIRTAQVIRYQIRETPADWREFQAVRAAEYEREARFREVQATPFERIIQRLRVTTTLGMFKVWCEGLTDGPTIDALLAQLPGATELGIVTDSLGGWNNILSPQWRPDRLRDGCHDLIVLVDGDKGRDYTTVGDPLHENATRICRILAEAGVDLIVLGRYGIENYFSQSACEAELGPAVAAHFPLPHDRAVALPNHSKNKNPAIARRMTANDIAGTDLLRTLEQVIERSHV